MPRTHWKGRLSMNRYHVLPHKVHHTSNAERAGRQFAILSYKAFSCFHTTFVAHNLCFTTIWPVHRRSRTQTPMCSLHAKEEDMSQWQTA